MQIHTYKIRLDNTPNLIVRRIFEDFNVYIRKLTDIAHYSTRNVGISFVYVCNGQIGESFIRFI